jgi:hypothetical protein
VEPDQIPDPTPPADDAATPKASNLWKPEDETYFAERPRSKAGSVVSRDSGASSGGGRWHYSANTTDEGSSNRHLKKSSSSGKKDRFSRAEDAMVVGAAKKKKKAKKGTSGPEDPVGRRGVNESSLVGAPESTLNHEF